jgi:D-beta-D-heptose 7-phosphate kinase/D-beta-D-heptose 1-phosphate adenosyltransferase
MKKILVIGETCKDIFCYGKVERLCPEAPAPVFNPIDQVENCGMAMNVRQNIIALGTECDIVTNNNWPHIIKTRYIHKNTNQMFIRIDINDDAIENYDVKTIEFEKYGLIVISDYCKGFLKEEDIVYIASKHENVFLDTKRVLGPWCTGVKYIKINNYEFEKTQATITDDFRAKLIITLGASGCSHNDKIYPVDAVEIKDLTGAGDTFIAALAVSYNHNPDIEEAIEYANSCATQVVQKRGVNTAQ